MSLRSLHRASIVLRSSTPASRLVLRDTPRIPRDGLARRNVGALGGREVQRRWASGKKDDEDIPFNVQLFESITQRVQKEKEEQIKQAQMQHRTARGRFFATMFGTCFDI